MLVILIEYLGYNRCGRLYLTNTPEGEVSLRRMFSRSTIYGEEAQLYNSPEEMRRWFPKSVSTDGIWVGLSRIFSRIKLSLLTI